MTTALVPPPATDEELGRLLLDHVHRGGRYGYYWQAEGKQSTWWAVGAPAPLPQGELNFYYGVHPTYAIPPTNRKGQPRQPVAVRSQLAYIAAINCVFGEFDAKHFEGGKPAALDFIMALTTLPSIIIDSGGGYHCYWLLAEPWILETDLERERARRLQAAWIGLVGSDDDAKDLARVLRIPGTLNRKTDPFTGKPLYGTFPRVTFVECDFARLYSVEELEALCAHRLAQDGDDGGDASTERMPATLPAGTDDYYQAWALRQLSYQVVHVTLAQDGEKHKKVYRSARLLGGIAAHGLLSDAEIETALFAAVSERAKDKAGARQTIRDGICDGRRKVLPLPEPPPQAVPDDQGFAYCPQHAGRRLLRGKKSGWYCSARDPGTVSGYCNFWWKGDQYQPPETGPTPTHSQAPPGSGADAVSPVSAGISEVSRPADTGLRPPWLLDEDELELLQPPEFLVDGIIPAGEVTVLNGPSDAGKTFVMVDIAERVAQHYPVVYVAAEDARGIRLRKAAWEAHYKRPKTGRFYVRNTVLPLSDQAQVAEFIAVMRPLRPRLIVLDTLSQCAPGADENSAKDMTPILANAQRVAAETGAAVVIIHHMTKEASTYRGSGTIKANTYGFLKVENEDGIIKLSCDRIKNSRGFDPLFFRLVQVSVGAETSCVPLPASLVARDDGLSKGESELLHMLALMTDADGGARTTDLKNSVPMTHATFYRILGQLKKRQCIVEATNGRSKKLIISASGRQLLAQSSNDPDHQSHYSGAVNATPFKVNPALDGAAEKGITPTPEPTTGITAADTNDSHEVAGVSVAAAREVSQVSHESHDMYHQESVGLTSLPLLRGRRETDTVIPVETNEAGLFDDPPPKRLDSADEVRIAEVRRLMGAEDWEGACTVAIEIESIAQRFALLSQIEPFLKEVWGDGTDDT